MNSKIQKSAAGMWTMLVAFCVSLLPFASVAQDCTTNVFLESQNVKAGELVTILGDEIVAEAGKQFVIEPEGHVVLQAARRIELNNGFMALTGGGLIASIVPCLPGGGEPKDATVVYPNPTDGILNIKAYYTMSALRLTDMSGFVLLEKSDINDTAASIDISMLKPGFYILEILTDRSVTEAIRIEKK